MACDALRHACSGFKTGDVSSANSATLGLRQSPNAIEMFLEAINGLGGGQDESLELFHAILGLQAVVLKRWESQSSPHPHFLRDFLFYIGIKSGEGTKHYPWPMVPNKSAIAAAAVLWKRSYLAASESQPSSTSQFHPNTAIPLLTSPSDLFQFVRNVLTTGTEIERSNATMFLSTLLSELNSGTLKSKVRVNLGAPTPPRSVLLTHSPCPSPDQHESDDGLPQALSGKVLRGETERQRNELTERDGETNWNTPPPHPPSSLTTSLTH